MVTLSPLQLISHESPYTVAETITRLKRVLQSKGNAIFACIEHDEEARKAGLNLQDEKVLIFGDPKVGTSLMQENPLIGIELPLRILVMQNEVKVTQIVYIDPISLGVSYKISKNSEILKKMSIGIGNLVNESLK